MPEPTPAKPGDPCWIELLTSDTEASTNFYGGLFGWTAESAGPEYGGYINISNGDTRIAGMMGKTAEMGPLPDAWAVYLASEDTAKTVEAATANGGGVMMPPQDIPQVGTVAYVTDPAGAAIGVFQSSGDMSFGYDLQEDGAPGWFELHTPKYDGAVAFYAQTFGWDAHQASDIPEFRYTTAGEGDDQAAGVMDASGFLPAGATGQWSIYFRVADVDATIAKAKELGGRVAEPAQDSPYGRLAAITDPTGAMFKLVQPN